MEPARTIIEKLGGPTKISHKINVSRTHIYKWTYPRDKGGTGGTIPYWQIPKLLEMANSEGVTLSEYDFVKKISINSPASPSE